jgi:hypothetical protein
MQRIVHGSAFSTMGAATGSRRLTDTSSMAAPRETLADFLRRDVQLTGTHLGCEMGACGEILLLPFYILTWPEAARALLMYRFCTLDAARAKSARMGWRGALYAWESADTGAETTPEQVIGPDRRIIDILCGREEQHISADVAYAVWQYWQATEVKYFCATPVPRFFLKQVVSGLAELSRMRMATATPVTLSDRTSITNMSTTGRTLNHGALEHPARDRCGSIVAQALAGVLG